ncbi:MAG: hypothetical protein RLZZ129_1192 [Verrucomicrobiota bacterium]|jgi:hypothetical protein|nr:hypothetical protein [Opitutaceae bacterium]HRJ46843.1 hypothetical protein [Opitutaceae bacterium]
MANPDLSPAFHDSAEAEARQLLAHQGARGLQGAIDMLMQQFQVLQTRAQIMLTITTLALTITGFSGPKIAAAGVFARASMALGILLVLISTLLILGGSLRIQWVTRFKAADDHALITSILRYRNRKTRLFFAEICFLVAGLACYVASVIAYFIMGEP